MDSEILRGTGTEVRTGSGVERTGQLEGLKWSGGRSFTVALNTLPPVLVHHQPHKSPPLHLPYDLTIEFTVLYIPLSSIQSNSLSRSAPVTFPSKHPTRLDWHSEAAMATLNLSQNGPSIKRSYQSIVDSPAPSGAAANSSTYGQWAVFSVQAPLVSAFQQDSTKESVLKVQTTGGTQLATSLRLRETRC